MKKYGIIIYRGATNMDLEKIGQFISECRKKQHLTQKQLAEQLQVTDKAVSKWECGNSLPDISIMMELCHLLKINIVDLLSGKRTNTKYYIHKTAGSMTKKLTLDNSLKGIENIDDFSNCFITKINEISKKERNVTVEVIVRGYDILETEKYMRVTMEVSDETGEMTVILIDTGNKEIRQLMQELKVDHCYRIRGSVSLNDEVRGEKLMATCAIKKIGEKI